MTSSKKSAIRKMEEAHWHETVNRQWELMRAIEEWMDVYGHGKYIEKSLKEISVVY